MIMPIVGIVFGMFCVSVVGSVLRGWVLTMLWAWFVVPTFGAQPLAIASAIGCAMIVGFLTHQPTPQDKTVKTLEDVLADFVAHTLLVPLIALGLGWIVKQWVPL